MPQPSQFNEPTTEQRLQWDAARMRNEDAAREAERDELARLRNQRIELLACLIDYVELEEQAAPYSSSPMRERARAAITRATTTPATPTH